MTRPSWEPSDKDIEAIEKYAAIGCSKKTIADLLGISPSTLLIKEQEHPIIQESYVKGAAKGVALARSKLMNLINQEHFGAIVKFLEKHDPSFGPDDIPQAITINQTIGKFDLKDTLKRLKEVDQFRDYKELDGESSQAIVVESEGKING